MIVLLGLLLGSFLGVIIERSLRCISIFTAHRQMTSASYVRLYRATLSFLFLGRSKCDACGRQIRMMENIPIVSYLYLRGACSACGARIPISLFFYELGVLAISLCIYAFDISFFLQFSLLLSFILLLMISVLDFRVKLIPDILIYALFWLGLLIRLSSGSLSVVDGLISAVSGYVAFKTLQQIYLIGFKRDALGDADPLLVFAIGVWLRVEDLPYLFVLASLLTLVPVLWMRKRCHNLVGMQIPFGPGLSVAGFLLVLRMAWAHLY